MADSHNTLPGEHMGGNNHPTGLILRNNTWHTSEHGMGRASKNNNHLSHDNQIPEVIHTFLWQRETCILIQRSGHPLHSVRVCHGSLSGQSVSGKKHYHGTMGNQRLRVVYPHSGQWPQKGHQYPQDKQSRFLHNNMNKSCLPHTRIQWHRHTEAEHKHMSTIIYNFIPITTALKLSPRKEIPRHCSYTLRSSMSIWVHSFYPWSQFPIIPDYPGGQGRF